MNKLLLGIAAGLAMQLSANVAMAATKLTYATYLSARHNMNAGGVAPYFERIQKGVNGELTFELFADGTLSGPKNTLQAIRDKATDMGLVVDLFVPGDLKASAVLGELAMLLEDPWVAAGATNEMQLLHCEQCVGDLIRNKIKPIVTYASNPFYLQCRDEKFSLAKLRGKRVRAVGPWASWVAAMGATPVNIPGGEVYEAMERGQIDCTVGALGWLETYSLGEVVKSVVMLPMGVYAGGSIINMNVDRWAELTPAQRTAFFDNAAQLIVDVAESYSAEDRAAVDKGKQRGIKFVAAPEDLNDLLKKYQKTELARVTKLAERRDLKDGAQLLAQYERIIEKWRAIADETGRDPALFKKRLDEEIFSKLK